MGRLDPIWWLHIFCTETGCWQKAFTWDYVETCCGWWNWFLWSKSSKRILSGQTIATSHDLLPPKGSWEKDMGNPLISGKSRLVKYYSLARILWNILVQSNEKLKNDPHWRRFVKQIPWKCDDILYSDSSYLLGGTLHRFWCNYKNINISSRYVQTKSAWIGIWVKFRVSAHCVSSRR